MGLKQIIKTRWIDFLIELVIGYILLHISFDFFLLYALFIIVLEINLAKNHLRKLIRFFNISTESKIRTLLEKEKNGEKEIKDVLNKMKKELGDDAFNELEKDLEGI